jgi:hypothetical protein
MHAQATNRLKPPHVGAASDMFSPDVDYWAANQSIGGAGRLNQSIGSTIGCRFPLLGDMGRCQ